MAAPRWMRSTGAAVAIAMSALPIALSVPGVLAAHESLDRDLQHRGAPAVSAAIGQTASAVGLGQSAAASLAAPVR